MNAREIVKNIILDGINQSKVSIWERLLLPDFTSPRPLGVLQKYKNYETWKTFKFLQAAQDDFKYKTTYYALLPLISKNDFNLFKYLGCFNNEDYSTYKANRTSQIQKHEHNKLIEAANLTNTQKLKSLFEGKQLTILEYRQADLNYEEIQIIKQLGAEISANYDHEYVCYNRIWRRTREKDALDNLANEIKVIYDSKYLNNWVMDDFAEVEKKIKVSNNHYYSIWYEQTKKDNAVIADWEAQKEVHLTSQKQRKVEIENLKSNYLRISPVSIIALCREILEISKYEFEFKKDIEIDFNPDTKILIVEYTLPNIEQIPRIKEMKYLITKDTFKTIEVSQRDLLKLFDDTCYSITLRSIYEILSNDTNNAIEAVNFNGWIKSINGATGKTENNCILSIQVNQAEFNKISLENVEPKTCFKYLKGVGSSKLYGITAIQPILQIQKDDKRFVSSQDIELEESTNLALMDWEDFEHLIREIFEKEFISTGGEVKVTQASRDGGVDAIAFDPDPIRGGKIVIQAKRYTNIVGVSAVRDLYGTVLNEGANKGILVTTSDYGTDSYEFAKGKPITLLNGANLLYLLEKHGTKAKIDIKEAKRLLAERKE